MTPILELREVRAGYGGSLVVDGVSLTVEEGECVALLGRNGAGKTTTINAVLGLARLRAGSVSVDGDELTGHRGYEPARRGVSVVPQGRRILPNLTVQENLLLGAAPQRRGPWDLQAVYALFPMLGERPSAAGTALSGGQMQMLAIGRALMGNPRVILLDEPTEGLAPVVIDQVAEVLASLRKAGTSLLIVEQHLGLVQRLADRCLVMAKGRIVHEGPVDSLGTEELRSIMAV